MTEMSVVLLLSVVNFTLLVILCLLILSVRNLLRCSSPQSETRTQPESQPSNKRLRKRNETLPPPLRNELPLEDWASVPPWKPLGDEWLKE